MVNLLSADPESLQHGDLVNFNEKMYETIRKHIDFELVKKMEYDII